MTELLAHARGNYILISPIILCGFMLEIVITYHFMCFSVTMYCFMHEMIGNSSFHVVLYSCMSLVITHSSWEDRRFRACSLVVNLCMKSGLLLFVFVCPLIIVVAC
jgi:hypothetical protein